MAIARRISGPGRPSNRIALVVVAVLLVVFVPALIIFQPEPPTAGYSTFLGDVQAGNVTSVVQTGPRLEVTAKGGAYEVTVPGQLTDVFGDVGRAASRTGTATPAFTVRSVPDTSWVAVLLSALLPLALVLALFVLSVLVVVRSSRRGAPGGLIERLREVEEAHRIGLISDDERDRKRTRIIDDA